MKKLFVILLIFLLSAPIWATADEWKIDTVHTNFYFDVTHTYAAVRGRFMEFTGDVLFNPDSAENSRFNFTIQVDSVDTGVGKRDTHLRTPDFFDAAKYPTITFRSSKVTKGAGNKYMVEGTLTIKDVSKDITLEFTYHGEKENPLKKGEIVAGLDSMLTIDRLAYHVGDGKFYKMGVVSKDVNILVTIELLREK